MAVAVIVLVPLVPRLPYKSTPLGVPAVFTAKTSPVADGDVVLTYPLPVGYEGSNDQASLWQAVAGMRFKLIGFRGALAGRAISASWAPMSSSRRPRPKTFSCGPFMANPPRHRRSTRPQRGPSRRSLSATTLTT